MNNGKEIRRRPMASERANEPTVAPAGIIVPVHLQFPRVRALPLLAPLARSLRSLARSPRCTAAPRSGGSFNYNHFPRLGKRNPYLGLSVARYASAKRLLDEIISIFPHNRTLERAYRPSSCLPLTLFFSFLALLGVKYKIQRPRVAPETNESRRN